MHNISYHEHAYAVLYARFARLPDLAMKLPRPQFALSTPVSRSAVATSLSLIIFHLPFRRRYPNLNSMLNNALITAGLHPVLLIAPLHMLSPAALSSSPEFLPPSQSPPESLPPTRGSPTLDLPPARPPTPFLSLPPSSDPGLLRHLFSLPRRQVELEMGRSDLVFPFVSLRTCLTTPTLLPPSTSSAASSEQTEITRRLTRVAPDQKPAASFVSANVGPLSPAQCVCIESRPS
jgi:hypothetical protein